ncbi:biotin--[acetyl-CoA-carboxylase] ligase [Methylocystis sp. MJC1]|uniref:biotin--[acetyl-CoA-carboxylase] ligase n=1 Tax=Methylocystis sp. MJC1 TaxID=2654282 RepID=UPI001FEDF79E|nr:biotin--[acetyl-CoA-carboxylase] ligase [Methylocystis sp. MJC1]KAF2992401.1 Bifunctional ligase/repressor BirA [Methylocystis sp. MJC1]UZX10478.1 biotin--[acetyl-CoA-carboxylase] ligase [Methylocystis sp. MJC1]
MQLGSIARARGVRLLSLEDIDSTNDEARRLIETGERGPLWIIAARQTKGRGRLGREWVSPTGNFYASFVFGDFAEVRVAPELGFVAGVAAMRALRATGGESAFQLKWPNDLLLDGAKLGGILLECVNSASTPVAIIGVGVNIVAAPTDLPYPARALAETGRSPSRESFFERFSDEMAEALDLWRGGEGFPRIREEWLGSAAGLGQEIRVVLSGETVEGRFETIDSVGRLVLQTDTTRRSIEAGDVLIGPRAAARTQP